MLSGTVLLTGGAGFLGRGIMRKAHLEGWDAKFIVFSRDEQKHYHAKKRYPQGKYIVGDIMNARHMHMVMQMCDYVIHTAAIKYIPECEAQPSEAIRINVDGSRFVMDCAREAGVQAVAMISTDKAAQPINTYGMTKALVERLVFETADQSGPTAFVACRYGNVIGSTGSIWPVFNDQYAQFGKLKVTDPEMTRFFFSVDDAVDLVVSALSAQPGTVVIPQPRAIKLGTLAAHLTKLWNARPFDVVGRRPGEKQHENMLGENEHERVSLFGRRYMLHGPTKQVKETFNHVYGMTSDTADELSPEEFVQIALESQEV